MRTKNKIEKAVRPPQGWLDKKKLAEKEEFEEKQKELEGVVGPLLMKVYQAAAKPPGADASTNAVATIEEKCEYNECLVGSRVLITGFTSEKGKHFNDHEGLVEKLAPNDRLAVYIPDLDKRLCVSHSNVLVNELLPEVDDYDDSGHTECEDGGPLQAPYRVVFVALSGCPACARSAVVCAPSRCRAACKAFV